VSAANVFGGKTQKPAQSVRTNLKILCGHFGTKGEKQNRKSETKEQKNMKGNEEHSPSCYL